VTVPQQLIIIAVVSVVALAAQYKLAKRWQRRQDEEDAATKGAV
jgi:hypothetical protein